MNAASIVVTYTSIDRVYKRRSFTTLEGARRFAQEAVGETPEISWISHYAVSSDGIGKITVQGASVFDLFPRCDHP